MYFQSFIIEFLHNITCAFYGPFMDICFIYYSCFVPSDYLLVLLKHIFYGDSLFGCLIVYSCQLILTSPVFYHFGTEMAHVCRCAIKQY